MLSKDLTTYQQTRANTLHPNGMAGNTPRRAEEIQQWLTAYLANLLEMAQEDVETTISFDNYGLDSAAAVGMTGALEAWLGRDVDPTLPYIYPTIATLAQHLADEVDIKAHSMEAL
jgi:acyl carrier protein